MWQKTQNIYFAGKVYSKFIVQLVKKSNLIEIQDQHRKCSIHWSSLIKIQLRRKTLMVSFSANQKRRLRTSLRVVGFRYLCPLGCVTQIWIWWSYKYRESPTYRVFMSIEPVAMKANFIYFWCVESEFTTKNWFHNWT